MASPSIHARWFAALAASVAFGLVPAAWAQSAGEPQTVEQTDRAADSFDDPPEANPDADEGEPPARLLPEDQEAELTGQLTNRLSGALNRRERRVRDENGRLVPSQPGGAVQPRTRAPQERARRAVSTPAIGTPIATGGSVTRANVAASPLQTGVPAPDQPGPYDPLGLRLGPLRVTTAIEQSIGTTSNADFTANGEGSTFSETRFELNAVSDLSVHELRGSIRGSYRKFFEDAEDLPTLDADVAYRYDLRRDTTVTIGGNWSVASENATDDSLLGLPKIVDGRPIIQQGAAFVEAERSGGKVFGRLRGSIGRELYEDIEFTDGTARSQADREATLFETALRLGYAHTPAFQPFVEGEIGYRRHDLREDFAGQNRDAARWALRAGVQLDLNEKLTGSIAAGIESVVYESARFDTIYGPSLSAALEWSPHRLTRVALTADTVFDDSVTPGVGGELDYRLSAGITHDLRENLALFGTVALNLSDPGGERAETAFSSEAGLTWSLNRSLALTGRVAYTRVESSLADADYDVKSASVGLRWQR